METFSIVLLPEFHHLQALRKSLRVWIQSTGLEGTAQEALILATHEAAANAIEHAGPDAQIEIEATLDDHRVTIEIRDNGHWKERHGTSRQDREGGMGLALIAGLMPYMELIHNANGTTLRITHPT